MCHKNILRIYFELVRKRLGWACFKAESDSLSKVLVYSHSFLRQAPRSSLDNLISAAYLRLMNPEIHTGQTSTELTVFDFALMEVSIAGMPVSTKDGFVGLSGVSTWMRRTMTHTCVYA